MRHVKEFERITDISTATPGQKSFEVPDQGLYVIYSEAQNSMTIWDKAGGLVGQPNVSIKINDAKNFIQKLTQF